MATLSADEFRPLENSTKESSAQRAQQPTKRSTSRDRLHKAQLLKASRRPNERDYQSLHPWLWSMGPMDQTNTDEHPQDKKKQADTLRRQRRKLNAALGTYPRYTGVRTCLQPLKTPCWVADFCAGACQRKIVLVVVCEMREKLNHKSKRC